MQYIKYLGFINQTILRKQLILEQPCIIQSKEDAYAQLEEAKQKRDNRAAKRRMLMIKE